VRDKGQLDKDQKKTESTFSRFDNNLGRSHQGEEGTAAREEEPDWGDGKGGGKKTPYNFLYKSRKKETKLK